MAAYVDLFSNKSISRSCILPQTRGRSTIQSSTQSIASNMASNTTAASSSLPPDLFDSTTLISLASTVLILAVAYGTSVKVLASTTPTSYRVLFIWHAFDALIHFFLEGSFLYQVCMPSWASCFATRVGWNLSRKLTSAIEPSTVFLQLEILQRHKPWRCAFRKILPYAPRLARTRRRSYLRFAGRRQPFCTAVDGVCSRG